MTRTIQILVYLLLVLFPFGQLLRVEIATNVHIVPQDIVVGLIALSIVFFAVKRKSSKSEKSIYFNNFILLQIVFVALGILSLIFNASIFKDINFLSSLLYGLRYLAYLSLLLVGPFFKDSKNIKKAFMVSGGVLVLIGYIQYFLSNDLTPLIYLGWDNHMYRMFSTFFDPNFAGMFYVLYFFLLLNERLVKPSRTGYLALVTSFFTLIAIYLTYSRTALVGLTVGLVAFCIIKKKIRLMIMSLITIVLLVMAFSDLSVEGLNPLRTASTQGRINSMKETLVIIEKNPIIGVGFNAFRYAQIRYGLRSTSGASLSNSDAGTDNSFLFVFATTGIVGLFIFVYSFIVLIRQTLMRQKNGIFLTTVIISLTASSMFLNLLFYAPIIGWIFLLISIDDKFN